MNINPPENSRIKLNRDSIDPELSIPYDKGHASKYFVALFLIIWLLGWLMGFSFVFFRLIKGDGTFFEVLWLAGWSFGGIFAAVFLYRLLRPSVAQKLTLKRSSILFDTGIPPYSFSYYKLGPDKRDAIKLFFPKRKVYEIRRDDLKTLELRKRGKEFGLILDIDGESVEIAHGLKEKERDWLLKILTEKYL